MAHKHRTTPLMTDDKLIFSLERFERLVHQRDHELAARELLSLLNWLDSHYGAWGEIGTLASNDKTRDRADMHIITRTVAAISSLFADPEFKINLQGWGNYVFYHRWLTILFGASAFNNADHVLHLMKNANSGKGELTLDDTALIKFSLLYSGDSNIPLQAEILWEKNKRLAAGLFLAMLSSRLISSQQAMDKKEWLLEWLPEKLKEIELHDSLLPYVHDVWMHCSYAFTPEKHNIKAALNKMFRERLLATGCSESISSKKRIIKDKPTMVIPLEWYTSKHAMYRCYSPRIKSLKNKFRVVAIATSVVIDDISRQDFDEVIEIERAPVLQQVDIAAKIISEIKPDIIYYPSIGMQLMVVALSTLRLAPIQSMGLGHPASSRSDEIDYVITRKDVIGDPERYSERIVAVPNDSMPHTIPHNAIRIEPTIDKDPNIVKIAITASVMKINSSFLSACKKIDQQCKNDIEFHFFVGHGIGISRHYIANNIDQYLPHTVIHPHLEYGAYITKLNMCDMFINPFPFGNANGIVDTSRQGLPGVCLDGAEVHSHADGVFFSLLGLPKWTITDSIDKYIKATIRLADNHKERVKLSNILLSNNPDEVFFNGDTKKFLNSMWKIYTSHESFMTSSKKVIDLT